MTISAERKLRCYEYFDTPVEKRPDIVDFRKSIHISPRVLRHIRQEWELDKKELERTAKARARIETELYKTKQPEIQGFDIVAYFKACAPEVARAIVEGSKCLNATSQRHFLQVLGLLEEKSELKVEVSLTADDHFRIRNEAKRRVSAIAGTTDGAGSVQPESHLLSEPVREDTGCEPGDTSIQTVESPD